MHNLTNKGQNHENQPTNHHMRLEEGGYRQVQPSLTLNRPLEECLAGFTGCYPIVVPRRDVTAH